MHFIARLLHSDAAISQELAKDEEQVQQELQSFFTSYLAKQHVLEQLMRGEPISLHLSSLQSALSQELVLIEDSEQKESEVLEDLKYLSHEHYIKKLEELRTQLDQARLHDIYTHKVLEELRDTLLSQARKVRRLLRGENDPSLRDSLVGLLTIEQHLVQQLSQNEEFARLFRNLFIGTQRRTIVRTVEDRMHHRLETIMHNIEIGEDGKVRSRDGHYLSELAARIFNRLESGIMDAVRTGQIASHPAMDSEYVNGTLFEHFVQEEILLDRTMGKLVPSDRTIGAFVNVFRSMYNTAAGAS